MPPSAEVVVEVILTADRRTHGARGSTTADEGDDIDVVAGNRLSLTTHSSPPAAAIPNEGRYSKAHHINDQLTPCCA